MVVGPSNLDRSRRCRWCLLLGPPGAIGRAAAGFDVAVESLSTVNRGERGYT
ncbi:hypothetical protein CLV40_10171 [Actinokineospora auranticolor]|uniref:Uncharacterized protein n=1 Tax=Actinokineospora auranticolor TaxID=155976 RepID=A0A2S6H079_9PSEU|nr:hypothetical protein CLV40_10171 [Actinokineospora auranticolor]